MTHHYEARTGKFDRRPEMVVTLVTFVCAVWCVCVVCAMGAEPLCTQQYCSGSSLWLCRLPNTRVPQAYTPAIDSSSKKLEFYF